jgi:hypothetical protein
MSTKRYIYIMSISAIIMTGCKKLYTPNITTSNVSYLVVEGVINTGQDSTIIKLSRTVNISGTIRTVPEFGAQVAVESDQNASYPLAEMGGGKYFSLALSLDQSFGDETYEL